MVNKLRLVLGLAVVVITMASPLNSTANADPLPTYVKQCANTYLSDWDWPAKIQASYQSSPTVKDGGNISSFNPGSDSYIILKDTSAGDSRNVFHFYRGTNLTIDQEVVSGTTKMTIRAASGLIGAVTIVSEPTTIKAYKDIWGSSTDNSDSVSEPYTTAYPESSPGVPIQYSNTSLNCVYTAHNVQYGPSFNNLYSNFSSHVEYTSGTGPPACGALQLGCWVGKIFDGVDNTFIGVGKAIISGFATMFMPDGTQIKASFDDFYAYMTNKLGFLAYPFTFIGGLYNAFTGSPSGCSPYDCQKTLGTLYGSTFNLDFSAPAKISTSLMDYIRLVIQSVTVLFLGFAVYHKYLKIMSRDSE